MRFLPAWIHRAGLEQAKSNRFREFFPPVFPVASSFAPLLEERRRAPGNSLLVRFSGTANTARFSSSAQRADRRAPDDPVANRRILRPANLPSGNSEISAPPGQTMSSESRLFSLGHSTSTPVPKTATVSPFAAIAPRGAVVSTGRAMPLRKMSSRATRSDRSSPYPGRAVRCGMPSGRIDSADCRSRSRHKEARSNPLHTTAKKSVPGATHRALLESNPVT